MTDQAEKDAFKAKLRSLNFGYEGGKTEFHGPTIRERQRKQESDADAAGIKWAKLSTRAELI